MGKNTYRYRLYGTVVKSDIELPNQQPAPQAVAAGRFATPQYSAGGIPSGGTTEDLRFSVVQGGKETLPGAVSTLFESNDKGPSGRSNLILFEGPGYHILRMTEQVDFFITPKWVHARILPGIREHIPQLYFLGSVMSLWLELRGVLALHASAVAVRGGAIAFMASSHAGKSSLVSAFVAAGFPLITDDILAVEPWNGVFLGHPSYPQMRMWSEDAERLLGTLENSPPVYPGCPKVRIAVGDPGGWGEYRSEALPLRAVYLLSRDETDGSESAGDAEPGSGTQTARGVIRSLASGEAIIELVRNSYAVDVLDSMGIQGRRLSVLGKLTEKVPVRRLRYPSGLSHLPDVVEAVRRDLSRPEQPAFDAVRARKLARGHTIAHDGSAG